MPVRLLCLLPHDHIEAGAVLVTEDEAGIVVVCLGVHMEGPFKVNSVKCRVPWRDQKQVRRADQPRKELQRLDSSDRVQRTWTYPLPGRGRCSWSAQSPCPAEIVEGVKGHRRGWRSLRKPRASGALGSGQRALTSTQRCII